MIAQHTLGHKFTFADLCAGIGGFRIGLEKIGGKCVYSAEIDPDCERTYKENYGIGFHARDLHGIESNEFPAVDLLCAGFPCQPFSIAGKRNGFSDTRGLVFFKIAEIASLKRPKVILLENVANLVNIERGETFKAILDELLAIGYRVFAKILDSADFGVAQSRKRVFIAAFRNDIDSSGFSFTLKTAKRVPFRSVIEKNDNTIPISEKWNTYIDLYTGKIDIDEVPFDVPKTRKTLERSDLGIDLDDCVFQMRSSGIRALSIDKPLPTFAVSVSGGGAMIPVYSKERRHLSLLEMRRLMGFPNDFKFPVSRTSAIKQLANAVCPPVVESVGRDLMFAFDSSQSIEKELSINQYI